MRKMSSRVLDSSAILALMYLEKGCEKVAPILDGALMSSVNVAEVFTKLAEKGVLTKARLRDFDRLGLEIVEFDLEQAIKAAELRPSTKSLGLSLGDRCCIGLALLRGATAVTADRNWNKLTLCKVETIR